MPALLPASVPLPLVLAVAYGVMSALEFVLYGVDKSAARRGRWRIPEATLHAVALACGWPGALLGRSVFRHKTQKQPFVAVLWLTVVANCAALAWIVSAAG